MSIFISSTNVPIGYTTPKFPSLFWPGGPQRPSYLNSFLYYSWDVWRFTIFWGMILSGSLYVLVGVLAASNSLFNKTRHHLKLKTSDIFITIFIILAYTLIGLIKGFIGGAIIGLILAAIYQAGSLTMSTWIPLTWAIAQILYDVASSYSTSYIIL